MIIESCFANLHRSTTFRDDVLIEAVATSWLILCLLCIFRMFLVRLKWTFKMVIQSICKCIRVNFIQLNHLSRSSVYFVQKSSIFSKRNEPAPLSRVKSVIRNRTTINLVMIQRYDEWYMIRVKFLLHISLI